MVAHRVAPLVERVAGGCPAMNKVLISGFFATALVGCGYNCQSTCNHVYAQSECKIATGLTDENDTITACTDQCNLALGKTGDLGLYDPYTPYHGQGAPPVLENDKQAALWMECVWSTAPDDGYSAGCDNLDPTDGGYCAPI
jgi:hypothetical protein